jgi:Trypsin
MSRVVVLAFLGLFGTGAHAGTLDSPIVGGTATTIGQYPQVVGIELGAGQQVGVCTGTLITPEWVLTAGHCVTASEVGVTTQAEVTAAIQVRFNTLNALEGGTVVKAQDSLPDPMFNINALGSHDSGLIHLATPVTDVTPVTLNFDASQAPIGVMVTMVGYGITVSGGQTSTEHVVDQMSVACNSQIGADANLLCFSQTGGKGKCSGDSGGPSFATINAKLVEVGITSFGDQTCTQFGADTRVDAEKAFITAHVPNLECDADSDCVSGDECFQHGCIVTPYAATGVGATCATNTDCSSGECGMSGSTSVCTMACAVGSDGSCPADLQCESDGNGGGLCFPGSGSGCCDASGRGGPTSIIAMLFVGVILRRQRRSKTSSSPKM